MCDDIKRVNAPRGRHSTLGELSPMAFEIRAMRA
jgi:hypothetical protein